MQPKPQPLSATESDTEAVILDADVIKAVASFLSALMEADFSLKSEQEMATDD